MDNKTSSTSKEDSDVSDDNLEIVIENKTRKRKSPPTPTASEKRIIESIEDELESRLEEKASKANLTSMHVKNIIKHVVTNEYVLNLIRNVENPAGGEGSSPIFEPKLTRSKAKELCSSLEVPLPTVSWTTPKPLSEVHALFTEELQEDSSGDEYVPGLGEEEGEKEDESEDDRDSSIFSDPPSVEPPTPPPPPCCSDSGTQTNWTEDGIFRIPIIPKDKEEISDEATIALRTRSKLCLSSTPLEVIEEAFIPPDITTDMYEMDCDNEDWMDFLKTFTRPLEEIVKAPEEEELDPEYNVLADAEVDKPDKEELRVDKAVKVSRKELNDLMAELYEFCTNEQAYLDTIEEDDDRGRNQYSISHLINSSLDNSLNSSTVVGNDTTISEVTKVTIQNKTVKNDLFIDIQIYLLEQQLRQHVQMLTQNFLLTYQHPELHCHSGPMKEYLLNLKLLAGDKPKSLFQTSNLESALNIVTYWENLIDSDTEEVKKMKLYVERVIFESLKSKQTGNQYILTFPTLILETISKSDVFLYPTLLPKIPFRSPRYFTIRSVRFSESEVQLMAIGLEQFMPIVQENFVKTISKKKKLQIVADYIHEYMLPIKKPTEILRKIIQSDYTRCANNPIRYYFTNKKAPSCIQYVIQLDEMKVLPPCQRKPDELPYHWKNYIYPLNNNNNTTIPLTLSTFLAKPGTIIQQIPISTSNIQKPLFSKGPISSSTPICPKRRVSRIKRISRGQKLVKHSSYFKDDPITKFVKILSKASPINKVLQLFSFDLDFDSDFSQISCHANSEDIDEKNCKLFQDNCKNTSVDNKRNNLLQVAMLPNMPSLFTPIKINSQNEESENSKQKYLPIKENISLEISEVGVTSFTSSSSLSFIDKSLDLSLRKESNNQENKIQDTPKDNKEDINALLIASSTVKPATRKEPSGAEKKRAKLKKEFLANLTISTPENREVEKQKNEMFALAYYDKMRETLEIEAYHKIMQILNDYEEGDAVDLYQKVEAILRPKYKDLADEFLLFLREREAAAVGRLVPWIRMNNRSKFLRKLEIYFKDQPSQLKKIYQCLTELSQTVGVSMEKIKSTLLPMFKGNAVLTDLFLQNFMDEPPPPSLSEGPYETFDINKEMARPDNEESFETIVVPDVEDKYGGATCICSCHEIEDAEYKSRYRHCTRCGTKFTNGKVYITTGRELRPARVSFLTSPNVDHQARLVDKSAQNFIKRKKRTDSSPSKATTSSAKENPDEDTDEDGDKKKKPKRKPPQRRNKKQKNTEDTYVKETRKNTSPGANKGKNLLKEFKASSPRKRTYSIKKKPPITKTDLIKTELEHNEAELGEHNETELEEHNETELEEHNETELEEHNETELEEHIEVEEDKSYLKPGSYEGQQKRLHEESCEEDQSAAGESSSEVKPGSPEQHTADSESEFCEESSQDNCESDSNSSIPSTPKSYAEVLEQNSSWKREEDKIILEVFQMENDKDHAFRAIAYQLTNRTVDEIKSRFDTLMDLLMKTVEDYRD